MLRVSQENKNLCHARVGGHPVTKCAFAEHYKSIRRLNCVDWMPKLVWHEIPGFRP